MIDFYYKNKDNNMKFIYFSLTFLIIIFLISLNFVLGCTAFGSWKVYFNDKCTDGPYLKSRFGKASAGTFCGVGPHEYWVEKLFPTRCEKENLGYAWDLAETNNWPTDIKEGDICIVASDSNYPWAMCDVIFGGTSDYRFDARENICVHCSGAIKIETQTCSNSLKQTTYKCESACGADQTCDEHTPDSDITRYCMSSDNVEYHGGTCDQTGQTYFQDQCNSTCGLADKNNICRSPGSLCEWKDSPRDGCTADLGCNGQTAGTGCCSSDCYFLNVVNSDGKIDMKDIAFVSRRFQIIPGDPIWNANADINHDGKVDMKDIALVAKAFGARC